MPPPHSKVIRSNSCVAHTSGVLSGADLTASVCHGIVAHHSYGTLQQFTYIPARRLGFREELWVLMCHSPRGPALTLTWLPGGRMSDRVLGGYPSLTSFPCQLVRNRFPENRGAERKKKNKNVHTGLYASVSLACTSECRRSAWLWLGICLW